MHGEAATGLMLTLRGLDFRYAPDSFRLSVPELDVPTGARTALVGPSGSGKTTLLHLMAGILAPAQGRVTCDGVDLTALADAARRDLRLTRIGLVFQEFALLEHLSVLDNVLLPYHIGRGLRPDGAARERARGLAARLGLADKLGRHVDRLSQGERQRVAVCRALVTGPSLVLADEPTGNLDPDNRDRVLGMLLEDAEERGTTLVTVTHDQELLPRFGQVLDVAELSDGAPGAAA